MNDPAMGAGIWLDTVLRRLRHAAGYCAARLCGAAAMTGRDHYSPIGYGTPRTDIVERLRRANVTPFDCSLHDEAADEIERLTALVKLIVDRIERLAFDMPPPNEFTPQFVMLTNAARRALEPKP